MSSKAWFPRLFEPYVIGKTSLKNRILMSPMTTNHTNGGYVTERLMNYYEERARGGVGLIIIEDCMIAETIGAMVAYELGICDDKFIPGLSDLTQVIHRHGAKAFAQLFCGNMTTITGGSVPVIASVDRPSSMHRSVATAPLVRKDVESREVTVTEIAEIVRAFAKAAQRAKKASIDGVEIHGIGGYLLAPFLSRAGNRRQDAYGGSLENRTRFFREIILAIKEAVGKDFPVCCSFNATEYGIEDGVTIGEAQEIARWLEKAGADALRPMAWGLGEGRMAGFPDSTGALVPLQEAIKKSVTIPVIAGGKLNPELGEKILEEGRADLISFGRDLIADPELANKAASGRLNEIIPCITCNHCMNQVFFYAEPVPCTVNASVVKVEHTLTAAEKSKSVLIVGGGPAGMEAARVAALRGHKVTLYEKERVLGGQLRLGATLALQKQRLEPLINYLINQITKAGVKVELGKEATVRLVEKIKPDAIVVATGVTPLIPQIPGVDVDKPKVISFEQALTGKKAIGDRVVIIGGGNVGCEVAEFLADHGKMVTIVEQLDRIGDKIDRIVVPTILRRLAKKGVSMLTGVECKKVTEKGLTFVNREGKTENIEGDIVLATGSRPNAQLFKTLEGKVPEIHLAGDCIEPRTIAEAIADGSRIGRVL